VALSHFMTPQRLHNCIARMTPDTKAVYNRCFSLVMQNVFKRVRHTHHTHRLAEQLISVGYIPRVLPASDDHHIYYDSNGFNTARGLPNTTLMRLYWERLFGHPINSSHNFQHTLQHIINTLTEECVLHTCSLCGWSVPINDLHSDDVCIKCYSKPVLKHTRRRGVDYFHAMSQ
jgi:hypothetical protein